MSKTWWWIVAIVVIVLIGGGVWYYESSGASGSSASLDAQLNAANSQAGNFSSDDDGMNAAMNDQPIPQSSLSAQTQSSGSASGASGAAVPPPDDAALDAQLNAASSQTNSFSSDDAGINSGMDDQPIQQSSL